VKGATSWLLTAPLLFIGLLAGHTAGYRWAVPDPHERAHALAGTGHAYGRYVPLVMAVAVVLVAAAIVSRIRTVIRGERPGPPQPWLLMLLPPLAFLVQEFLERLLSSAHVHVEMLWEPAVLIGLQLQIPFALLALAVARLLARVADALGYAFAANPRLTRVTVVAVSPGFAVSAAPARVAARGWTDRGPPPR
jgi:hypothetical protein